MGAHKFRLEGGKSPRFWTRVFPDGVSTEISETNRESVALYLRGAIIGTK